MWLDFFPNLHMGLLIYAFICIAFPPNLFPDLPVPGAECNEVHGYLKSEMVWANTVLWLVVFSHDVVECDVPDLLFMLNRFGMTFFTYVRAIRAWLSLQRGLFLSEYFGFTFRACLSRRGLMFKGFRYVVTVIIFFFLLEIFFIKTSKFCFIPGTECNEVHGYLKSEMMWTNTVLWLVIFLHDIVECDGPICILY